MNIGDRSGEASRQPSRPSSGEQRPHEAGSPPTGTIPFQAITSAASGAAASASRAIPAAIRRRSIPGRLSSHSPPNSPSQTYDWRVSSARQSHRQASANGASRSPSREKARKRSSASRQNSSPRLSVPRMNDCPKTYGEKAKRSASPAAGQASSAALRRSSR